MADIATEDLTIPVDDGALPLRVQGPSDRSSLPALVIVPSIFGPADDLLERLADLGEAAFVVAPDPFWRTGEGVVPYGDMDTAFSRLSGFDMRACAEEMAAAVTWARAEGNGDVIGLGICFGGPFVLRLAADGLLNGVVTWHGSRMDQTLGSLGPISCPMRHHLGSEDPITPPETIEALHEAFADHDDVEIVVHRGATHGFSHDGDAFDETAYRAGHGSVRELLGLHPQ